MQKEFIDLQTWYQHELEAALDRIKWLERGLKLIGRERVVQKHFYIRQMVRSTLDGEPTTADKYNKKDIQ